MNERDDPFKQIKDWLIQWSLYMRQGVGPIGYVTSPDWRQQVGFGSGHAPEPEMPAEVECINVALAEMLDEGRSRLRRVIYVKYLDEYEDGIRTRRLPPGSSNQTRAVKLGITLPMFNQDLREAHSWLAGRVPALMRARRRGC